MTTVLAAFAYLSILLAKRALAFGYARAHPAPPAGEAREITIVQAILGGDPALEETLAWNLAEHPAAAFIWLVDRDDAAGGAACARLAATRAGALDLRIVPCDPAPANANPKLFKLAIAEPLLVTERFVVLDDDTMLPRSALDALHAGLDGHTLATGLPSYVPASNVPGRLVATFVNDNAALTYLATAALMPPVTINGMCYATTRDALRAIGGFAAYLAWLPDDLAIARGIANAGGSIVQTAIPHAIRTSVRDAAAYVRLMHRWFLFAVLLLDRVPQRTRAAIVVLHGLPPVLLWIAFVAALGRRGVRDVVALSVALAGRAAIRADVRRRILGSATRDPALSLLSELAEPLHALHALARRRVRWRSRRIVVRGADDFSIVA